eukprot:286108-Pyramimonas_sp.AAC.1
MASRTDGRPNLAGISVGAAAGPPSRHIRSGGALHARAHTVSDRALPRDIRPQAFGTQVRQLGAKQTWSELAGPAGAVCNV